MSFFKIKIYIKLIINERFWILGVLMLLVSEELEYKWNESII